jgi:hypothetical protein
MGDPFKGLTNHQRNILSDLSSFMIRNPEIAHDTSTLVTNFIGWCDDSKSTVISYKRYKAISRQHALKKKLSSCIKIIDKNENIQQSLESKLTDIEMELSKELTEPIGCRQEIQIMLSAESSARDTEIVNLQQQLMKVKGELNDLKQKQEVKEVMETTYTDVSRIMSDKFIVNQSNPIQDPVKVIINVHEDIDLEKWNSDTSAKYNVEKKTVRKAIQRCYLLEKSIQGLIRFMEETTLSFIDPFKQEWSNILEKEGRCKAIEAAICELLRRMGTGRSDNFE